MVSLTNCGTTHVCIEFKIKNYFIKKIYSTTMNFFDKAKLKTICAFKFNKCESYE